MNGTRWRSTLLAAALGSAAMLAGARAEAGNISILNPVIGRPTANDLGSHRTSSTAQQDLSYEDCIGGKFNLEYTVSIAPGAPSGGIEIWGTEGEDCTQSINRDGIKCIKLGSASPNSPNTLDAHALVKGITTIDPTTCNDTSDTTIPHVLTIYWMISPLTDGDTTNSTTYKMNVDVLGPLVPVGADLQPGNELLILSLPAVMDTDRAGYYVYCNPVIDNGNGSAGGGGSGGEGGASGGVMTTTATTVATTTTTTTTGAGGSGGSGGSGVSGGSAVDAGAASCSNTIPGLTPGVPPPRNSKYLCGTANLDATSFAIQGATNGTQYTVAVAAYDNDGNIGPLSTSLCMKPAPTDTFYDEYCKAGGAACPGCGQCSIEPASPLTVPALGAAALAALGLVVRRTRRRTPRSRKKAA